MTIANVVVLALSFLTSPLLARFLGPTGRGEVAAVMAVVTVAPWAAEFGLTSYVFRQVARDELPLGTVVGTIFPTTLILSIATACTGTLVAHLLGRDRPVVIEFLEIGIWMLPLTTLVALVNGLGVGRDDWSGVSLTKLLTPLLPAVALVVLAVLGDLTVESTLIAYFAGSIVAVWPLLRSFRGSLPLKFDPGVAIAGLRFGASSWIANLASLGVAQLDQILLTGLVASRELGYYALAVSLSTATSSLTGAIVNVASPGIARGDKELTGRSISIPVAVNVLSAGLVAALAPFLVRPVFGASFAPMTNCLIILCAGSVLYAPCFSLSSALVAAGSPRFAALGQIVGLGVTIPALFIILPGGGAIGAAWVSVAGNAATLAVLAFGARAKLGLSLRAMFILSRSDFVLFLETMKHGLSRFRGPAA